VEVATPHHMPGAAPPAEMGGGSGSGSGGGGGGGGGGQDGSGMSAVEQLKVGGCKLPLG